LALPEPSPQNDSLVQAQPEARTPAEIAHSRSRDAAIREFVAKWLPGANEDIYEQMFITLCRLARDQADRGDVKLLARALAELRYALKVFSQYKSTPKISIFGSSRTPPEHADYQAAVEFARAMRDVGWMVITGAGDGIMKAGHGGAGREASFGVAIRLPFEQRTNDVIENDKKLINFNYFFTRKLMFVKESEAIAVFPGGFGTQDELFEALTLVQTGKAPLMPIVMVEHSGGRYWQDWLNYVRGHLLAAGLISPEDLDLFFLTNEIPLAVEEVLRFYRVHHSNRYVGPDLVLRLHRKLSPAFVEMLNEKFGPRLLASGKIEQTAPLPGEEHEYPDLPRLRLHFNRRSFGWLRRMINDINKAD
jgi:uncharacterized protein (TIGR00730 family)